MNDKLGVNLTVVMMLLGLFLNLNLTAQNYEIGDALIADGNTYYIDADAKTDNTTYLDLDIPTTRNGDYLTFIIKGGDGGKAQHTNPTGYGGVGTSMEVVFHIGTGDSDIDPGSSLRFIIGKKGTDGTWTAGGGGGTGILYKKPGDTNWKILAVSAGGGGGAMFYDWSGASNGKAGSGGTGEFPSSNSSTLNGGGGTYDNAFLGGLTGHAAITDYSNPVGGLGGSSGNKDGGFGFGGGGAGRYREGGWLGQEIFGQGGGGGGYSGGTKGGDSEGGKGGTNFVNSIKKSIKTYTNASTGHPQDGFVAYSIVSNKPDHLYKNIKSVASSGRCMDIVNGNKVDETNIQLYNCTTDNDAQKWYYFTNTQEIRMAANPDYCLDLKSGNASNGANIQLYHCNETTAQQWIYETSKSRLHIAKETSKCITLKSGATSNGTNISLYNCNSNDTEKWTFN